MDRVSVDRGGISQIGRRAQSGKQGFRMEKFILKEQRHSGVFGVILGYSAEQYHENYTLLIVQGKRTS